MGIIYEEKSRQFHLYNDKISYIMTCLPNGQLGQLYYGKRLRHRESFGHLLEFAHRDMAPCVYEDDTTFSLEHIRQEYPAFGTGDTVNSVGNRMLFRLHNISPLYIRPEINHISLYVPLNLTSFGR